MIFVPRRRSLLIKAILIVPATWFIVSMLFTYNAKLRIEKTIEDEVEGTLQENIGRVGAGGRHPRQSLDDNKLLEQNNDREYGVLPLPQKQDLPGDLGHAVKLGNLTEDQQKLVKLGYKQNAFNQYASDLISLHRTLEDVRPKGCKTEKYSSDLPQTSVIVCFHNEAWSVLLRTVHSILDRSPPHLLKEIILVDDFSDMPHLGRQLTDYVEHLKKVKVLRAKKREGLIRARLLGAAAATAPVLTYLDSHCECATGWLEPLLQRIANNWTTVVCPVIDVIDDETFAFHWNNSEGIHVGGFDWNLQFNWHIMPEREKLRRKHSWDPVWFVLGSIFIHQIKERNKNTDKNALP